MQKSYSDEFKKEAVKQASESDLPVAETAKKLGVNVKTLREWIKKLNKTEQNKKVEISKAQEQKSDEIKPTETLVSVEENKTKKVQIVSPSDNDKPLPKLTGDWYAVAEAVVGLAHRRVEPPLPCQDAFCISTKPRITLLVADGAGSAAVSEIGANAVVHSCQRLLHTLDDQTSELLDSEKEPEIMITKRFALRLVKHAMGTLEDTAKQYRREIRDFRCTLLVLLAGKERLLWIKVGDGALVIEDKGELRTLGEVGKGEFANQTTFIDDKLMPDSVQFGITSSIYVSGLAAMSDGAAERLVVNDGSKVASRMSEFFNQLRKNSLNRTQITDFFHDKEAWRGTSGDDKCLALASR
jgi:transposase-like protein